MLVIDLGYLAGHACEWASSRLLLRGEQAVSLRGGHLWAQRETQILQPPKQLLHKPNLSEAGHMRVTVTVLMVSTNLLRSVIFEADIPFSNNKFIVGRWQIVFFMSPATRTQ